MDRKFGSSAGVCPNRLKGETLHRSVCTGGFRRFTALKGRNSSKKFFIVCVWHAKENSDQQCKSRMTVEGLCCLASSLAKVLY